MKLHFIKPNTTRSLFLYVQLIVGLGLLLLVRTLYFEHPYYRGIFNIQDYRLLNTVFIGLVFIWCFDALRKFLFVKDLPVTTSSLIFVFFFKVAKKVKGTFKGEETGKLSLDKKTKNAFLALIVKAFFFPIMFGIVVGNANSLISTYEMMRQSDYVFDIWSLYHPAITLIFFLDTLIFGLGYVFEAKWLNNTIRSVEPTMLGWVAALSTYPPFSGLTGSFIPLDKIGITVLAENQTSLRVIQLLILLCHFLFLCASISLGTRATNLTNRGIVSRGSYSIVRHPAYTVKLIGWLLEGALYAVNIWYFVAWLGWVGVYSLRAWTEERHLSQDPDYIEYKKKVKWLCIPGVF